MQAQLELQQRMFLETSLPRIAWLPWTGNPGTKTLKFVNKGGRFRIYQRASSPNIDFMVPSSWIAPNEESSIVVNAKRPLNNDHEPNNFTFELYADGACGKMHYAYAFTPGAHFPIETSSKALG
jgi:hypothetical protein